MKREFLKGLGIADENIDKIMTEYGNSLNQVKEKLSTTTEELKITKEKLETYKENATKVESLINENKDLKAKYDEKKVEFEENIKSKDKEISNINKKHTLLNQLKETGAVGEDLLIGKFNLDDIELNSEGKIKDFDTLIKPLKETYKHMFKEVNVEGRKPQNSNNGNNNDNGFKDPFSKDYWNVTEQAKLFKSNPELYSKLKKPKQ